MENYNASNSYVDRPNAYRHICPYCGNVFYGRKNRIYCPINCKKDFNNNKAARKRERISEDIKTYSKNEEFLHEHCKNVDSTIKLDLSFARMSGFVFFDMYKLGKDEYDGKEWYKIGNYEYRVDEILRLMLIRKYKKANGHDNT